MRQFIVLAVFAGCSAGNVQIGDSGDSGDAGDTGIGDSGDSGDSGIDCGFHVTRSVGLSADWETVGPAGGDITALLALPGDVVLAGTASGNIYKSTDAGLTFGLRHELSGGSVTSLATDGVSVFAGVFASLGSLNDGVWVSVDSGDTFSQSSAGLPANAKRVQQVLAANDRVYALVQGNSDCPTCATAVLYRKDTDTDWVEVVAAGIDPDPGGPITGIAASGANLYAADGARFYVSADEGETFAVTELGDQVFAPNGLAWVSGIFVQPDNATHMVITTFNDGLIETFNGGTTWDRIATGNGIRGVAFDGDEVLLATSDAALLRTDGRGSATSTGECLLGAVLSAVAIAPDDSSQIYLGGEGMGVLRSRVDRFAPQTSGIEEVNARIRVDSLDRVWALTNSAVYYSNDDGITWVRVPAPLGCMNDVAVRPGDGSVALFAGGAGCVEDPGVVAVDLSTAIPTVATGFGGLDVLAVKFDPSNASRVFAYAEDGSLWSSNDSGVTFAATDLAGEVGMLASGPLDIATDGSVYFGVLPGAPGPGVHAELWRSPDAGATVATVWNAGENDGWTATTVKVAPDGSVWLTGWYRELSLLRSTDGQTSFEPHGEGLDGIAKLTNAMAFGPSGEIVVATELGVHLASDGTLFAPWSDPGRFLEVAVSGNAVYVSGPGVGVLRRALP